MENQNPIETRIRQLLSAVLDPRNQKPVTDTGLIEEIEIKNNQIVITLGAADLSSEVKSKLNFSCLEALYPEFKDYEVNVHVAKPKVKNSYSPIPQVKNIIAIASGKGGVGKSTVSVNTALGLAESGFRVGLMDADLYGPSIPTMMGLSGAKPEIVKVGESNKIKPIVKHGIELVSIGFIIEPEQAVVLRGPRLGGIIKQFISECLWSDLDYLIIDLPPGTGDIQLTLVQTLSVTGVVMVTTPQEVSVVDAVRAANMFMMPNVQVPILGVVENMSWFTPEELPDNKYYIFGSGGGEKMAKFVDSPLLGQIPLVQGVREGGDQGAPVMTDPDNGAYPYFRDMVDQIIHFTDLRNSNQEPTKKVEINQ